MCKKLLQFPLNGNYAYKTKVALPHDKERPLKRYESFTYLTDDYTSVGIGTFHLIKKWGCRGFVGPFPPPLWISKTSNIIILKIMFLTLSLTIIFSNWFFK